MRNLSNRYCVKSVQIRSYFWSVFSCIRTEYGEILRIQENTNTGKYGLEITPYLVTLYPSVFSPNAGKDGPEIAPYVNTFHGVRQKKVF